MRTPWLLDLCCSDGAASMGYHRAGFNVVGVDIAEKPEYPFEFHQGDALEFLRVFGGMFDVVVGSPPCQRRSRLRFYQDTPEKIARYEAKFPDLIDPLRDELRRLGKPYVIENVEGALRAPITLCGPMFGLKLYRHREFESNIPLAAPCHPRHEWLCARNGYLPTPERPFMTITGGRHSRAWQRAAADCMGAPWITTVVGICEAIPPAYTEHVGAQILNHLALEVAA